MEAIETAFHPVLVYNNKDEDAKLLARFEEPSWNNPVVRFLAEDAGDVIPRKDRVWTSAALVERLELALEAADRELPPYLELAREELVVERRKRAVFAMHCYWEGEARLGRLEGVLSTRSAWAERLEVVEVEYDADRISYATLVEKAAELDCTHRVWAADEGQLAVARARVGERAVLGDPELKGAKLSDQRYHLGLTNLRYLPMTPLQAAKVNAACRFGEPTDPWLSPRQRELMARIEDGLRTGSAEFEDQRTARSIEELGNGLDALQGHLAELSKAPGKSQVESPR